MGKQIANNKKWKKSRKVVSGFQVNYNQYVACSFTQDCCMKFDKKIMKFVKQ